MELFFYFFGVSDKKNPQTKDILIVFNRKNLCKSKKILIRLNRKNRDKKE